MIYKCIKCKEDVNLESKRRIRCPNCGGRILVKKRSAKDKEIKAR